MKNKIYHLVLGLILLITIFFRFYYLSSTPPSPTVDEVTIGYNAYSILNTGADEYGNRFPILLRAYDDWRPALYVYLVIPFVAMLGLDVLAVRLPAAILSTLSVVAVFFLLKELFNKSNLKLEIGNLKLGVPEIATLLFAISPWHIYISRLGHEVNASSTFLILAILFFFRFVNKQKYNLYFSALFFALSFDSYQSTKIVVPLVLLSLFILYFKKLMADRKTLAVAVLVGFVITLPILITSFDQNALLRFKGTSLLSTSESYFSASSARLSQDSMYGDGLGRLFDNNKFSSIMLISHAYLSHLDPVWLFINQGSEQFKAPTMGLLYLFEFPLIVLGLFYFTKSGLSSKNAIFIILWGAVSILPGAITNGYAHPLRIFSILPVPQIIASVGLMIVFQFFNKFKRILIVVSCFIFLFFSLWFFHSYFTLMPREQSEHFQYGVIDSLVFAAGVENKYKHIIVSNQDKLFESYMYYLYLHKYDPVKYQHAGGTISGGFTEPHTIGKYTFVDVNDKLYKNTLYILNPSEVRRYQKISKKILKRIYYMDGSLAFIILETK